MKDDNSTNLSEAFKISAVGKIFLAAMAAWVLGRATKLKIKGTPAEIQAVKSALLSSRRFREELEKPDATIESVIDKLNLKNASAAEFERILGVPWPL